MITNGDATALISALKNLLEKNNTIRFPLPDEELRLAAGSTDGKYQFSFVVNRKINHPDAPKLKTTFLVLYKNAWLMRIDVDGPAHNNSDDAIRKFSEYNLTKHVPTPHIHLFDEKHNIAVPLLNELQCDKIETVGDLVVVFIEFLKKNSVVNYRDYHIQPSLV